MAPSLIGDNYSKDLSRLPLSPGGSSVSNIFYALIEDDTLLRITEHTYAFGDYQFYAVVERLGSYDRNFFHEEVQRLRTDEKQTDEQIIEHLLSMNMEDSIFTKVIGRFAYQDYTFTERDGSCVVGKQIKGAFLEPDSAGQRIAGIVYTQLIKEYDYLICDNSQTVYGAILWAFTMRLIGRVDIYDSVKQEFVEELGEKGTGVNGFIAWDIGSLLPKNLGRWTPYPYDPDNGSCYHIVHVISVY